MASEKGGSKADTLVKVVLFFFISLLSFSVGTFVGKQVSDSDHRRMALEGEFNGGRQVASTDEKSAATTEDEKVSEKEVEALTEEFVNHEKTREPAQEKETATKETTPVPTTETATEHKEAATEPNKPDEGYKTYPRGKVPPIKGNVTGTHSKTAGSTIAAVTPKTTAAPPKAATKTAEHETAPTAKATTEHEAPIPRADATNVVAEKVVNDKAPTDGAKEEKKAAPGLPSVASSAVGKYTVQVGSYLEEKEAKNRSAELKGKGWNAFYLPATVKGKTWYRVLVGLFNNQDSAKQFRAQFMKEANTQSAIVQKIVQ